ncbi:Hypothetical_protein [Hexamita inflata]|uniref:Hypothetical_protein n=1 Tax=Hexamita inflata TaxID=28002 RepID=A0AA86N9B1_9EUKA|nr:Hypothetical protein HINF_LOCUS2706 [Hexamita inflata]
MLVFANIISIQCQYEQIEINGVCECYDTRKEVIENRCMCKKSYFQLGSMCMACVNGDLSYNTCQCKKTELYDLGTQSCKEISIQGLGEIQAEVQQLAAGFNQLVASLSGPVQQQQEKLPTGPDTPQEPELEEFAQIGILGEVTCQSVIAAREFDVSFCQKGSNLYNLKLKNEIRFSTENNYVFIKTQKTMNVQILSNVHETTVFAVFGFSLTQLRLETTILNITLLVQARSAALVCDSCNLQASGSDFIFQASAVNLAGLVLYSSQAFELFQCFVQIRLTGGNVGGFIGFINQKLSLFNVYDTNYTGQLKPMIDYNVVIGYICSQIVTEQSISLSNTSLCILGQYQNAGQGSLLNDLKSSWEQLTCDQMCERYSSVFINGLCFEPEPYIDYVFAPAEQTENTAQCVGDLVARGLDIEFCVKTESLTKVQLKLNTKFTKSANYIFLHTQKAVDVKIISDVSNKEVFSVFGYSLNRLILQDTQMSIKLEVQAINAALVSDRCNLQATNSDFVFVAASFNVSGLILRGMQVCQIDNCSVQFRLVGLNVGGIVGFIDQQMKFQMSNTNITGLLKDFNSTDEKTIGFIAAMSEIEQQVNLSYVSLCLIGQYQNVGKGSLENIIQGSWEQLSCEVMCGRFNQIFAYGLCLNETDDPTAFVFQNLFGDVVQDEEPEPDQSSTPIQDSVACDQIIQAQDLILTTCNHQKRIFNLKLKDNIKFTHSINYLFLKTERVQKVKIEIGAQNKQIFAVFGLNSKTVKIISSELNVNLRAQALKTALICEKCNLQTVNSQFVFQASSAQLAGLVLNGERLIQIERCFMQFRLIGMNVGGIVGNIQMPVILNIMDSNYTGILTAFTDAVNVSIGFVAANCSIAEQSVGLNNTSLCIMGKYENVGTGTLTNNIMSSWEQLSCDAMCGKYGMKFYIGICVEEDDDTSFILTMPNKME